MNKRIEEIQELIDVTSYSLKAEKQDLKRIQEQYRKTILNIQNMTDELRKLRKDLQVLKRQKLKAYGWS